MIIPKLLRAGVGERPLIFITHSLGGLIAKRLLAKCAAAPPSSPERSIERATAGAVFYSTPHFGSPLAYITKPAVVVVKPSRLTIELLPNAPFLYQLNDSFQSLSIPCISFGETLPTALVNNAFQISGLSWSSAVVPLESAYPGFGKFVVLDNIDHVMSCKPESRAASSYAATVDFLKQVLQSLRGDSKVG